MDYLGVKDKFMWYLTHSLKGDEVTASEIYTEDALLEFPQSGERFRGKENFIPWRSVYPAGTIEFEVRSIRGEGDSWTVEGRVNYGDATSLNFVDILHFRGDLVDRETIYVADTFPPDKSRERFADNSDLEATEGLPLRVRSAS